MAREDGTEASGILPIVEQDLGRGNGTGAFRLPGPDAADLRPAPSGPPLEPPLGAFSPTSRRERVAAQGVVDQIITGRLYLPFPIFQPATCPTSFMAPAPLT